MKCVLFFLFLIFLNLIGFSSLDEFSFLLTPLNLNDLSWNLISLVSFVELVFSHNLMKILAFIPFSLSFFFLVEIFSSLMAFSFSHCLIPPQNLISPWWILFSELDESSYFELVILFSLSPLRTIPSGVESIRSTLPHLEI